MGGQPSMTVLTATAEKPTGETLPTLLQEPTGETKAAASKVVAATKTPYYSAEEIAAMNPNVEVISSRAITMLFTKLRATRTTQADYVNACDRLMTILAEEGLARLPCVVETTVATPCGEYAGLSMPATDQICGVDIVRSGGILLEAVRKAAPDSKTAKILIQRDEETAIPKLFYSKLPPNIADLHVVLCDPMLGTGGSASMAIDVLKDAGVKEENILFINVVSCPEGLKKLKEACPGVKIVTLAVDLKLNDKFYITPGVGDFGDRYYGTYGYVEGLWGTGGK